VPRAYLGACACANPNFGGPWGAAGDGGGKHNQFTASQNTHHPPLNLPPDPRVNDWSSKAAICKGHQARVQEPARRIDPCMCHCHPCPLVRVASLGPTDKNKRNPHCKTTIPYKFLVFPPTPLFFFVFFFIKLVFIPYFLPPEAFAPVWDCEVAAGTCA
jgi:hypothetical protein